MGAAVAVVTRASAVFIIMAGVAFVAFSAPSGPGADVAGPAVPRAESLSPWGDGFAAGVGMEAEEDGGNAI